MVSLALVSLLNIFTARLLVTPFSPSCQFNKADSPRRLSDMVHAGVHPPHPVPSKAMETHTIRICFMNLLVLEIRLIAFLRMLSSAAFNFHETSLGHWARGSTRFLLLNVTEPYAKEQVACRPEQFQTNQ